MAVVEVFVCNDDAAHNRCGQEYASHGVSARIEMTRSYAEKLTRGLRHPVPKKEHRTGPLGEKIDSGPDAKAQRSLSISVARRNEKRLAVAVEPSRVVVIGDLFRLSLVPSRTNSSQHQTDHAS